MYADLGDFFNSWQRRLACFMLASACLIMAVGLRSLLTRDEFWFGPEPLGGLILSDGYVGMVKCPTISLPPTAPSPGFPLWQTKSTSLMAELTARKSCTWEWNSGGIAIGNCGPVIVILIWNRWIVLPVSLLSAYLLLSKRRKTVPALDSKVERCAPEIAA